jgi:hypothetical protein
MQRSRPDGETAEVRELMNRTKMRTDRGHRALWVRVLALIVVAFTLASQASSLAHLVLIEHAVCPEHGEWLHADELATHAEGAPGNAPHAETSSIRATVPTDGFGHEHEHCAVLSERRQSLAEEPSSPVVLLSVGPDRVSGGPTYALSARSVPIFQLAPKTSPPV